MNKIIIALSALAALSTASLAGQRTDVDARDRAIYDMNSGSVSYSNTADGYATSTAAFAVEDSRSGSLTAFERVTMQSIQNENSRNN